MVEAIKRHHISFKNAFNGLWYAFTTQPNFKIHFFLSFLAIIFGIYLGVSYLEMTILILVIIAGLGAEMVNTALESITDLVTSEWKKEAKIAKDVSAGMMLLFSFGAIMAAILIFGPKFIEKIL